MSDDVVFEVTTGFGANTRVPYVQVLIHAADWMTQMPPATARELALNLLQAAEAAEGDGFLMTFLQETLGIPEVSVQASILYQFLEYREKQRLAAEEG